MLSIKERILGALVGLAAGDALGTTLEFKSRDSYEPITDIIGGGPFNLKPGQYTDDTSMALCLSESLIAAGGFDPVDQLQRYVRWHKDGHFSSAGYCFDIGSSTLSALYEFQRTGNSWCGSTCPDTAGNGALMRLAPVPLAFYATPAKAVRLSGDSSRTTHGAIESIDACRYFAGLLVGIFQGASKSTVLDKVFEPVQGIWESSPLIHSIAEVASGSFKAKQRQDIYGTSHVAFLLARYWRGAAKRRAPERPRGFAASDAKAPCSVCLNSRSGGCGSGSGLSVSSPDARSRTDATKECT